MSCLQHPRRLPFRNVGVSPSVPRFPSIRCVYKAQLSSTWGDGSFCDLEAPTSESESRFSPFSKRHFLRYNVNNWSRNRPGGTDRNRRRVAYFCQSVGKPSKCKRTRFHRKEDEGQPASAMCSASPTALRTWNNTGDYFVSVWNSSRDERESRRDDLVFSKNRVGRVSKKTYANRCYSLI